MSLFIEKQCLVKHACFNLPTETNAIHLLQQNIDKIDWEFLSMNPNAFALIDIIIENEQWDILSSFNIFTYDEDALNE